MKKLFSPEPYRSPHRETREDVPSAGFRENEHTADWELSVWAPDLPGLLEQAARGMYALCSISLDGSAARREHALDLTAPDSETLLVSFLEELLYLAEQERIAFDTFKITVAEGRLKAELSGAPIRTQGKEIKAVTYHNLAVRQGPHGLEASIVFDV